MTPDEPDAASPSPGPGADGLDQDIQRVLEPYLPAWVVVDADDAVVRLHGDTGPYLRPMRGIAARGLSSRLHEDLRVAARYVLEEARRQQRPAVQDLDLDHPPRRLRLVAAPLAEADASAGDCVLAFIALGRRPAPEADRARPRAAVDEQEAANEQRRPANDEDPSASEAPATSREGLQSTNAELQALNAEIQHKNTMLARANSDLRNLMESTQLAILFLDPDLRVTGFTSGSRDLFDLRDTDRGRPIGEIATRITYTGLADDVHQVLRTLSPVERVLPGGSGVPTYLLRMRPYRTVENVIEGVVMTFIDITEREQHEAERARLASIVEWAQDAIIGYTAEGVISSWNGGAERVLGYAADAMRGKSLATLLPIGAEEEWPALLAACVNPEGVPRYETTWQRKDGRAIAIDLSCASVTDADGKVLQGSAIARDVSDRRKMERALRQSEIRLAAILEQTSMGLAQTDLEGRFELVNPRFCEIVGRPARELYRMRVQDIIHPEDLEHILHVVRRLLVDQTHFQIDVRFLRPDGASVWTSHSVTAMLDSDRRPQHMISAVLDITEQKLASQHVELMLDELNHRVKNTLATVQSIAMQTMARATDLDGFRVAFNARLLALSKTHNLLAADAWTGARLRDIVIGELEPYRRDGTPGDAEKRIRVAGDDVRLSPKHALALSMAFHELATNAAKYGALSAPAGTVTVRWALRQVHGVESLHLEWIESGGPAVSEPAQRGFGSRLISEGLAFELNGEAVLIYAPGGVQCVIDVPLTEAKA